MTDALIEGKFSIDTKPAQKDLESFRDKAKKLGNTLSRALTLPLIAAGTAIVKFGADAEESLNKVRAVFGDASYAVEQWSAQLSQSLGRNKYEIIETVSTYGNLFVGLGFATDQAASLSEQLVEVGYDLASFNNLADKDVFDRLRSGILGSSEALDKLGVNTRASILNQELLNQGIKGGVKAATEQEKIFARLNVIMNSTKQAQGDVARSAHQFTNSFKGMISSAIELASTLGQHVTPILARAARAVTHMIRAVNDLDASLQILIISFGFLLAIAKPLFWLWGALVTLFNFFVSAASAVSVVFSVSNWRKITEWVFRVSQAARQTATVWKWLAIGFRFAFVTIGLLISGLIVLVAALRLLGIETKKLESIVAYPFIQSYKAVVKLKNAIDDLGARMNFWESRRNKAAGKRYDDMIARNSGPNSEGALTRSEYRRRGRHNEYKKGRNNVLTYEGVHGQDTREVFDFEAQDTSSGTAADKDAAVQANKERFEKMAEYRKQYIKVYEDTWQKEEEVRERQLSALQSASTHFSDTLKGLVDSIGQSGQQLAITIIGIIESLAHAIIGARNSQRGGGGGILGRAGGGFMPAGEIFRVNENRMGEYIIPKVPSQAVPASQMGGGGQTFNISFNNPSFSDEDKSRFIQEALPAITQSIGYAARNDSAYQNNFAG